MIRREHHMTESELRWREGEIWLKRNSSLAGFWEKDGCNVTSGSMEARPAEDLPVEAENLGAELAASFSSVRLSCVKWNSCTFIYLNLDEKYSAAVQTLDEARAWTEDVRAFEQLPQIEHDIAPGTIEFSPESFGFLLHESLGHRLEADDFSSPISWKTPWAPMNFDVWDTTGRPGWLGYVPIDDNEVAGRDVRLLDGESGQQQFLSFESGNGRAISHEFHPLVRQRSLEVVMRTSGVRSPGSRLRIDGVAKGASYGDEFELISSRQVYIDDQGAAFRIPPLKISGSCESIRRLEAFGERKVFHPAAGCSKAGQSQLPVTFFAPSAWSPIDAFSVEAIS